MWLADYAISKGYRLKYSTGLIKDGVAMAGDTEEMFSQLSCSGKVAYFCSGVGTKMTSSL
jgi:hypothetical protein